MPHCWKVDARLWHEQSSSSWLSCHRWMHDFKCIAGSLSSKARAFIEQLLCLGTSQSWSRAWVTSVAVAIAISQASFSSSIWSRPGPRAYIASLNPCERVFLRLKWIWLGCGPKLSIRLIALLFLGCLDLAKQPGAVVGSWNHSHRSCQYCC